MIFQVFSPLYSSPCHGRPYFEESWFQGVLWVSSGSEPCMGTPEFHLESLLFKVTLHTICSLSQGPKRKKDTLKWISEGFNEFTAVWTELRDPQGMWRDQEPATAGLPLALEAESWGASWQRLLCSMPASAKLLHRYRKREWTSAPLPSPALWAPAVLPFRWVMLTPG